MSSFSPLLTELHKHAKTLNSLVNPVKVADSDHLGEANRGEPECGCVAIEYVEHVAAVFAGEQKPEKEES